MTSVHETQEFHDTTQPYYSLNDVPEWERLDEMHRGIDAYLGHKLSLSPAVQNVKKILEIGCGSGAWAIQAAQTYPEAIVTAIDVSPLPPRPLPSNMQFLQLDIMEPLPFEPGCFDIIHARFVFVHLPRWKQVIENVISLLKPQGWLWIEDVDLYFYDDGPQGLGPSLKLFNDFYLSFSSSRDVDPFFGTSLEPVLKELGSFLEVNHVEIKCETNGRDSGTSHQSIGQVVWTSLRRSLASSKLMYNAAGMTSGLKEGMYREAEDPLRSVYLKLHMTWAQKK